MEEQFLLMASGMFCGENAGVNPLFVGLMKTWGFRVNAEDMGKRLIHSALSLLSSKIIRMDFKVIAFLTFTINFENLVIKTCLLSALSTLQCDHDIILLEHTVAIFFPNMLKSKTFVKVNWDIIWLTKGEMRPNALQCLRKARNSFLTERPKQATRNSLSESTCQRQASRGGCAWVRVKALGKMLARNENNLSWRSMWNFEAERGKVSNDYECIPYFLHW